MIIELFSFKKGFTSKLPSFFLILVTIYKVPPQPCSSELRWQSVCFCMCIDFSRGYPAAETNQRGAAETNQRGAAETNQRGIVE